MLQKNEKSTWRFSDTEFASDLLNPNLATSPWSGHRKYAYDLLTFVKPRLIVELGTHYGCSFFAFLQAIKDFDLNLTVYAIDTWVGDEHAGFYGDDVFDLVKETLEKHFKYQNAHLLRKRFDEALDDFEDESIDLIHIDGLHTYEAVKEDFETWLPKLAENGIVLFHDVAPDTGYGSAKYWSEIKRNFPHFNFLYHSWGLGILFPKGDFWYHKMNNAEVDNWLEIYRFKAEKELFQTQLKSSYAMIEDRDEAIQSQASMIEDRDEVIQSQASMIEDRDEVIQSQASMIEDRDEVIQSQASMIEDRDEVIQSQASMIEDRDEVIQSQASMIEDRDEVIQSQTSMIEENLRIAKLDVLAPEEVQRRRHTLDAAVNPQGAPFSDIAFSLYHFIERLLSSARQAGVRDLYFLSREGRDLKELFEIYQSHNDTSVPIRTHYLEASRRSSFLPSLGPLSKETFEVLFRQYRAMSLESFLNSLGLEAYGSRICEGLGLDEEGYVQRREDLPTDPLFEELKGLTAFQQIYESERESRSTAFAQYVAGFTNGVLPEKLNLVDVGWKGSIQDNLYRWLSQQKGEQAQIQGYYIGLIAPGAMSEKNIKTGLLFEGIDARTPGFNILNENRSLFEVLLPARHGGPHSYKIDADGKAVVLNEPYYEKEMVDTHIQPVVAEIFEKFKAVTNHQAQSPLPDNALSKLICKRHARMVLNPSQAEINWIFNVHHRENFGVFEESSLSPDTKVSSLMDRLHFTYHLVRRHRPSEIGFWPYLTLKRRAFYGISAVYRMLRKWQERSLKC